MIRIVFRHSSSTHYQTAIDLAREAAASTVSDMGRGRKRHDCTYTIAQRAAAAQLLDVVVAWKGTQVYLAGRPVLPRAYWMLQCFLASPPDKPACMKYCRGTFVSDEDYFPPCRLLHSSPTIVHWLFPYGQSLDALHFQLDRARLRAEFESRIVQKGLEQCPLFDAAAVRAWLRALPAVVEIGDDGPAGLS